MTVSKLNNVDTEFAPDQLIAECGNCSEKCTESQLQDIKDFDERVEAGCELPAGECPKCGALCYLIKEEKPKGGRVKTPPKLLPGYRANFKTLQRAARNGDLALVSAIRKADQKPVALICAMCALEDGTLHPAPLAVMVEGNPYRLFEDPTASPPKKPRMKVVRKTTRKDGFVERWRKVIKKM